jgi:serine/threonine protein kinase
MGVVYRAVDTRLDREVALKVIRQRGGDTPIIGQRLVREARLAARIEHPNIATVYELDEVEGQPFVAMELIRGQTLRDRLAEGPLQTGQVVSIMLDVCRGLEAAHERDVVHRDLKPENVAVTQDGTVKILDFGVSRLVERLDRPDTADGATRTMPLTQEGHVAGTIAYMSPEQLAGAQVDPRGDIFALGVVIFEVLNGKRPFEGGSREALASESQRGGDAAALAP